ncbi:MAG: tetratricopeptide repeat protein, partial [Bacillota bacterium]
MRLMKTTAVVALTILPRLVIAETPTTAPTTKPTLPPTTQPVVVPAIHQPNTAKAELLFGEGRDALFRRDYETAIARLTQAAAEDPGKATYRLHLARAYQYASKPADAEKLLRDILTSNPDHVEAGQLLGEIYARQGNWKAVASLLE